MGLNVALGSDDGVPMRHAMRLFIFPLLLGAGLVASMEDAHAGPGAPGAKPAAVAAPARAEPVIVTQGPEGEYLRRTHDRIHGAWHENFIKTVAATYPTTHAMNNPSRQVMLEVVIRWDGTIAEVAVKKSSGTPAFDRAAMDVVRKAAPYALPSADVVSDDTYAHLEWTFSRDHRACAAGARVVRKDDPLDVSLPRLMLANRVGEALRRVRDGAKEGGTAGLDRFARLFLSRTSPDPVLNVAASVALAQAGDRSQVARLRTALGSRATVDLAARGLFSLGIDVCDAVRTSLEGGKVSDRELALTALHAAAAAGADVTPCAASLATIVADVQQPKALRLSAMNSLLTLAPAAARSVVISTIDDKDPALRGAAILASVRKGAGRSEMYRMAPLLRDKAVEVRGAASAGMVRAGGDTALDQLYLLARETDPRPGQLVAAELAQMSTKASAAFLGTMVKKDNPPVQVSAARALAARKDAAARAELDAVNADARMPTEVRTIVAGQGKAPAQANQAPGKADALAAAAPSTPPTESVHQMLKESRNQEAAGWIVEKFESLPPRDAIDVLGAWLRRAPAAAAEVKPATPAARPQTAAPDPAAPTTTSALTL